MKVSKKEIRFMLRKVDKTFDAYQKLGQYLSDIGIFQSDISQCMLDEAYYKHVQTIKWLEKRSIKI